MQAAESSERAHFLLDHVDAEMKHIHQLYPAIASGAFKAVGHNALTWRVGLKIHCALH